MTVAVATVSTAHFSFIATGETEQEAVANLMMGWRRHALDTDADPSYVTSDDINVMSGPMGSVFRDGSRINPR